MGGGAETQQHPAALKIGYLATGRSSILCPIPPQASAVLLLKNHLSELDTGKGHTMPLSRQPSDTQAHHMLQQTLAHEARAMI
jgi:hypothetical protein